MRIGIRPINDFAFKKIFGTSANKLALISFLNAVLRLHLPIVDVTIVNPYNLQDFLDDKLSILDIKAVDANGSIYLPGIGMQPIPLADIYDHSRAVLWRGLLSG